MAIIISSDEIKKSLPEYSPDKAELFHHESAKMADKDFARAIKETSFREVILLSGGAASGKTEFLATHLTRKKCVIFDTTLNTEEGAKIKIHKINEKKKIPIIYA